MVKKNERFASRLHIKFNTIITLGQVALIIECYKLLFVKQSLFRWHTKLKGWQKEKIKSKNDLDEYLTNNLYYILKTFNNIVFC